MLPPEQVFPQRKAAEFDETGRPHHFLFYTSRPNFFNLLYEAVEHLQNLDKFEDNLIRQQKKPDPELQLELTGSEWLPQEMLELKLVETIRPVEYRYFMSLMDRLANHPYSFRVKDFIHAYRKTLLKQNVALDIPKPHIGEDGRAFITVYECLRKRARGDVTIRSPGTGKILINGEHDISYFEYDQAREQVSNVMNRNLHKNATNRISDIMKKFFRVFHCHDRQMIFKSVNDFVKKSLKGIRCLIFTHNN